MRIARWLVELAITAIVIAGLPGRAHADPEIEKADQLFVEGKALLSSNLLQACDKFVESLRHNPAAIGTLLNVALCDEKLGRIASAVARFTEARDRAKEQGLREHLRAAEDHIAALAPDVPHLTIRLTEQLPETSILVDDRVIAGDRLDSIPVDPGERVVVISAPGRLPYRLALVIVRAERKAIVVPALARSVVITSSRRRIGQITTAAGGVAFGVSIGLAIYGVRLHQRQLDEGHCMHVGDRIFCDDAGQSASDRARTYGNIGTAVGVLGLAAAGVGIYLWASAPRGSRGDAADRKLTIVPEITSGSAGVTALGRF